MARGRSAFLVKQQSSLFRWALVCVTHILRYAYIYNLALVLLLKLQQLCDIYMHITEGTGIYPLYYGIQYGVA